MRIPMVDLAGQYRDLKAQIEPAMAATLDAAQYILGPNVQAFEAEAAKYLGVKHAITCANGTDALHLALLAAEIGPGDEVITTPFTFIATAEAIAYVGAKAVFVDIDPQTLNIDVDQVAFLDLTDESVLADEVSWGKACVEPFLSDGVSNCAICRIGTGGVGCEDVRNETARASQVHMARTGTKNAVKSIGF